MRYGGLSNTGNCCKEGLKRQMMLKLDILAVLESWKSRNTSTVEQWKARSKTRATYNPQCPNGFQVIRHWDLRDGPSWILGEHLDRGGTTSSHWEPHHIMTRRARVCPPRSCRRSRLTQLGNNAARSSDLRLDENSALSTGTCYSSRSSAATATKTASPFPTRFPDAEFKLQYLNRNLGTCRARSYRLPAVACHLVQ